MMKHENGMIIIIDYNIILLYYDCWHLNMRLTVCCFLCPAPQVNLLRAGTMAYSFLAS